MWWCLKHLLGHHSRRCMGCRIITQEFQQKAEGLWLVYISLAWALFYAGIILAR